MHFVEFCSLGHIIHDDTYSKDQSYSYWLVMDNYYKPLQQCMVAGLHSYLWNNNSIIKLQNQ